MVSRCLSAVESINDVSHGLERKYQQNDVFYAAKKALAKINRERRSVDSPRRLGIQRHASLPANILKGTEGNVEAGKSYHDGRSTERRQSKSERLSVLSRENLSVKSCPARCPASRPSSQKPKVEERPKTGANSSKSYTNKCVKEILSKIERGAYASEWYNFSSPTLPTPKWIDFYAEGHGGVLDAFLCQNSGNSQKCYMMDVRIGDKVGRLLKYPENIRIGENGDSMKRVKKEEKEGVAWSENEEHMAKCKQSKTRPFPLSWREQFDWENVRVITTTDEDKSKSKEANPQNMVHQLRKHECKQSDSQSVVQLGRGGHGYSLRPIDIRIVQSMPNVTTRQKSIRGFRIENVRRVSPNDNWDAGARTSRKTMIQGDKNQQQQQTKDKTTKYNYLSADGKSISHLGTRSRAQKRQKEKKAEKKPRSNKTGAAASYTDKRGMEEMEQTMEQKMEQEMEQEKGQEKELTEKHPSRYEDSSIGNEDCLRDNEGSHYRAKRGEQARIRNPRHPVNNTKFSTKFDIRIPSLEINSNTELPGGETHYNTTGSVPSLSADSKPRGVRTPTSPTKTRDVTLEIEALAKGRKVGKDKSEEGTQQGNSARAESAKEQLRALRQSISQSLVAGNLELEKDLQLLNLKNQKISS